MKWKIVFLIALFPLFTSAQNKEMIDSLAKTKLADLLDTWSLGISDSADLDVEAYNQFKSFFDTTATIDDDLNVFYTYAGFKKPGLYKAGGKPELFDLYAHDLALAVQITSMNPDRNAIADSVSKDPTKRIFRVSREVAFQKTGNYVIPDSYADAVMKSRSTEPKSDSTQQAFNLAAGIKKSRDSVYRFTSKEVCLVTMAFNADNNTVAIINITTVSNLITCTNDADNDAVADNLDSLPKTPGDITANGKPDYDLDGIADKEDQCVTTYGTLINKGCPTDYFYTRNGFDVFLGGQLNSADIHLPALNQLGYTDPSGQGDAIDVLQSKKGVLKNPGQIASISAGGSFVHYFGNKKKKAGISVGLVYTGFTAEYTMDSAHSLTYTYKASDGTDLYRRRITFDTLHEDIHYNVFNVPVLFNYRLRLGKKNNTVIKLQSGPSLMIFSNTSNYNARIDIGGIYQIDTVQQNKITYYDHFASGSFYNIFITSDSINAQSQNPGADYIFQQLKNAGHQYDFASNKNYIKKQNLFRLAVAFNFGLDLQQKISEGLTLKAGATFVYAPLLDRKEKYKPLDSTSDTFQSVYYANAKSYYSTFGISIGLVYNW